MEMLFYFLVCIMGTVKGLPTDQPCVTGCHKQKIEKHSKHYFQKVETIKRDILQKLGIEQPPDMKGKRKMVPKAVLDNFYLHSLSDDEEFHKAEQKIKTLVIPGRKVSRKVCPYKDCVTFQFVSRMYRNNVENFALWIYLSQVSKYERTFVTIIQQNPENPSAKPIFLRRRVRATKPGWIGITIRDHQNWLSKTKSGNLLIHLNINIKCVNCRVDLGNGKLPYLDITDKVVVKRRQRRSVMCTENSTSCCLDSFYITFKEIKWDSWIFAPRGYNARQCRGKCDLLHSETNEHGGMVQALSKQKKMSDKIKLCCTAHTYAPLDVLYEDQEGNIVKQSLANMIATQCGCG